MEPEPTGAFAPKSDAHDADESVIDGSDFDASDFDAVEKLGASVVQHGPANSRVYLMKLADADMPGIVADMEVLARERGYTKLFARAPERHEPVFAQAGFVCEARVPGLERGTAAGCFLGKFLDPRRAVPADSDGLRAVLDAARAKAGAQPPSGEGVEPLGPEHAEALSTLYADVFASYPFPIVDPAYVRGLMADNVAFYGDFDENGVLLGAASAEQDRVWRCVEMTDFATRPEARGRGTAGRLLARMEQDMAAAGHATAFTIARAVSVGMNAVFARAGYVFDGTLCNNTHIGGGLESMNVWHKPLGV